MEDVIYALHRFFKGADAENIAPYDCKAGVGDKAADVALFQRRVIVIVKVIQADHFVPCAQEFFHYVGADEPCPARHQALRSCYLTIPKQNNY